MPDVIDLVAEAPCFVLGDALLDCALYEGSAELGAARAFAAIVAGSSELPRAIVMDVGLRRDGAWLELELNAAWGAGLNGCDPTLVLRAIEAARRAPSTAPGRTDED